MEKEKKSTAKKATVKKVAAKKTAVKKIAAKKEVAKKVPAKKAATKKTATKKTAAKATNKTAAKKIVEKNTDPTLQVIKKCWTAMDDKKAEDIKILDVSGKSPITNYFILATATSAPHMRALAGELDKTLHDMGIKQVRREYNDASGWIVVDGFDFMAHIFLPEQRGLYGIESLWKDAVNIDPSSI